jgi:hypothetical protein
VGRAVPSLLYQSQVQFNTHNSSYRY